MVDDWSWLYLKSAGSLAAYIPTTFLKRDLTIFIIVNVAAENEIFQIFHAKTVDYDGV